MKSLLRSILSALFRCILSLRYEVTIHGVEKLRDLKGPVLVMPNHPGYVDPALIMVFVGRWIKLRPLVFAGIFRHPLFHPLMRIVDALEVPDLQQHSQSAREQTEAVMQTLVSGLKQGGQFLIYPSGRLQRRGVDVIGGTRAASEILQAHPDTTVVMVRTVGLWGSMSGWGMSGKAPELGKVLVKAFSLWLANLLFFLPRRKVKITVEVFPPGSIPSLKREEFNPWLERWYNAEKTDIPIWVPYHFLFGSRTHEFPAFEGFPEISLEKVTPETRSAVLQMLEEKLKRPLSEKERQPETQLDHLGLDSLDRMELALQIEQRFTFRSDLVANTVGELWGLAQGLVQSGDGKAIKVPDAWTKTAWQEGPAAMTGETVGEAFVHMALQQPGAVAVADDLSGVLTYERLLVSAVILSKRMGGVPGDAVGILLPSSVAATSVYLAILLAGKIPVFLNWTTGPANLAHAAVTMKIQKVVSSQKFVDRIGAEVKGTEYLFLESLRGEISFFEKLVILLRVKLFGSSLLTKFQKAKPDDPAVVLFTSGSEKAPKAVPLTHRNVMSNIGAVIQVVGLTRHESVLAFLPPFHSFGLVCSTLLPLLNGMRVIHHPDPTDARALNRKIAAYQATLIIATPTFINYILSVSKKGDFGSVHWIATGAEKCPERIFNELEKMAPQAEILEGYGITECSPVVALNAPHKSRRGTVGWALPGVEALLADPDSLEPLSSGSMGMLLVSGPSIFSGYIHHDGPSPFVERNGKRWFVTGDLVEIDPEHYIHFRGRLKRFIKAGGEMISLPAIEEPLSQKYPATKDGPQVAVEGVELQGGGRRVVLFTTLEISLSEANGLISQAGLRGLMRLDEVRKIDKIPILGTGKTDYKVLRAQIEPKT